MKTVLLAALLATLALAVQGQLNGDGSAPVPAQTGHNPNGPADADDSQGPNDDPQVDPQVDPQGPNDGDPAQRNRDDLDDEELTVQTLARHVRKLEQGVHTKAMVNWGMVDCFVGEMVRWACKMHYKRQMMMRFMHMGKMDGWGGKGDDWKSKGHGWAGKGGGWGAKTDDNDSKEKDEAGRDQAGNDQAGNDGKGDGGLGARMWNAGDAVDRKKRSIPSFGKRNPFSGARGMIFGKKNPFAPKNKDDEEKEKSRSKSDDDQQDFLQQVAGFGGGNDFDSEDDSDDMMEKFEKGGEWMKKMGGDSKAGWMMIMMKKQKEFMNNVCGVVKDSMHEWKGKMGDWKGKMGDWKGKMGDWKGKMGDWKGKMGDWTGMGHGWNKGDKGHGWGKTTTEPTTDGKDQSTPEPEPAVPLP